MDEQVTQNIETAEPVQQKMVPQDEVNRIVAREKQRAHESATRTAEEKHQRDLEALNAQRMQQQQRNAEVPRDVDAGIIQQQVQDQFNRVMQEHQKKIEESNLKERMSHVANNYLSKVESGRKAYGDFDEVTADFDPTEFPQLTYLLSGIENAGDVLYEISKNRNKLSHLLTLVDRSPRMAQSELLKLSKSIADNRNAQSESQNQNVSEPLDRLTPSKIAGSNGKMSVSDLRNQSWLRG